MFLYRSPSDRTLLSILAYLNAIVWIASVRPPISNSSSSLFKFQGIVPSAPITIGITYSTAFLVPWQGSSTCFSFRLLLFSLFGTLGLQSSLYEKFSLLLFFFFFVLVPSPKYDF